MKYINYILILLGAILAMYATVKKEQNQYLLIIGIVFLMLGIYRIARTIPSRSNQQKNNHSDDNNAESK